MGNKIFYYTDFNTFTLILENGTLRFKESTASNDCLDTKLVYSQLKQIANKQLEKDSCSEALKFIYEFNKYKDFTDDRICLVSCFTTKEDSRLLWDAYTMNRKDRKSEKYNGVCIEFDENKIKELLENVGDEYVFKTLEPIMYGDGKIFSFLNDSLKEYLWEYYELKKDEDQHQDIVPTITVELFGGKVMTIDLQKCIVLPAVKLIKKIENYSPLFKHDFWKEESEIRAVLSVNKEKMKSINIHKTDNDYYYDLGINNDCIKKVILGPEFNDEEIEQLKNLKGKIDFSLLKTEKSNGTNVIRSSK